MRSLINAILIIFALLLISCSADVNLSKCDINVKQGSVNIQNESGYFDYGNIPLGASQTIMFTIENTGIDVLKLFGDNPVSIFGENESDFIISATVTTRNIDPNSMTTFSIKFQPIAIGQRTATVKISSNDKDKSIYTFMIIGNCTQPAPEIHLKQGDDDIMNNVGTYEFGLVNVGSVSDLITFTIENNGNEDLKLTGSPNIINISGTDASMFTVYDTSTQSLIGSSESTTFNISFQPTSPGIKTAKISILNDDSDENPYTFTLYGTGVAIPKISVKQGTTIITSGSWSYDFEDVLINESSNEIEFTIENLGTSTLHLSNAPDCVKVLGADSTMFIVNQLNIKENIMPGDSTKFGITFSPNSSGQKTATISIANNDLDENPFWFTIIGTCVEPEINIKQGSTDIPDSTGTYDFGNIGINNSSGNVVFTIENLGDGNLELTNTPKIAISGSDASMFSFDDSITDSTVLPGVSTTFTLKFSPSSLGNKTATITIANTDLDENPYTFTVKGLSSTFTHGQAIGWIGGGINGWKTGDAPSDGETYQDFDDPSGICLDSEGNIYIAESANARISKWDKNGNAIGWIGNGNNGWQTGSTHGNGYDYKSFYNPQDVFVDTSGYIYVADRLNHRISKWDSNGNAIGWIGGSSNGWKITAVDPYTVDGNDYQAFHNPVSIFVDTAGYIYVADRSNHRICKWDSSGNAIGWIGGNSNGWKTTSGSSSGYYLKYFNYPEGISVDSSGNIYICDKSNDRLSKWDSSGNAIGWLGGGSNGWKTGPAPYSGRGYQSFQALSGNFVSSDGYIYITDKGNHRISKWDISGNAIGWIGGGSDGWKTSIAPNSNSGIDYQSFYNPSDIVIDDSGFIYVADLHNQRVCKWKD